MSNLLLPAGATDSRSAALKSLNQRRDYGAQPTAACISKSTERALREEGRVQQQPSRAASGNELDALDWEEEEEWADDITEEHAWEPVGLVRQLGRQPQDCPPGTTTHTQQRDHHHHHHQQQQQQQQQWPKATPAVNHMLAHLASASCSHQSLGQTSTAQQQNGVGIPLDLHNNSAPCDNTAADVIIPNGKVQHRVAGDDAVDAMHLPGRGQAWCQLPAQSGAPDAAACHLKATALQNTGAAAGAEGQAGMSMQSDITIEQSDYELAVRLQAQEHAMHRQHSRPVASGRVGVKQKQRQTSGTLHAFFKQA